MAIKTLEMMYEGKAKQVFATSEPDIVMVHYRDDATAGDGEKKGTIEGKGIVNNRMSNAIMKKLTSAGIPTHYLEELNDRDTLVKRVEIIPLEVIIRNIAAGSFSKRLGIKEGTRLMCPTLEFSYKNDDLHDPLINSYYALALGLATQEEINKIKDYAFRVNEELIEIMDQVNITLVDFKIEFGRTADGSVILADEISPDTCRFWDKTTGEHLDKDLFRRGLGGESEAYQEVMSRILG
jgi:phosphoribosylaminoimidazole-succinocarboxamide synthase